VASMSGALIPLSDLARIEKDVIEKTIYHKNLKRVVYVTGDVAEAKKVRCTRSRNSRRRSTS